MLKVFCILLILSISQSLAVLSNAQQDLAIKPIVYKQPINQYLPANIPEISTANTQTKNQQTLQPQYQSTFIQTSSPYNYNPPSHHYLSSFLKEEVTSTPISYISPSNQINQYQPSSIPSNFNGPFYQYHQNSQKVEVITTPRSIEPLSHHTSLNQYQPQYDSPSNYNRPSNHYLHTLPQEEVLTTPKSNIPTSSSSYYGPTYQYLPATTQSPQTTTPLPNVSQIQNSGNFNNFPNNHKTHWSPIIETTTSNIPSSNVQPPIELHHGYRYIEPALKVNSSNFQTINGVIYNELGLGQNETNSTQKPQAFVPQNPSPSRTEIKTQQGYVYGNTQYNPHYPNTTVLIPIRTSTGSYNSNQSIQKHNKFDSEIQNLNHQQLEQSEKQSPTASTSQQQSTQTLQYHNNIFDFQNLNQLQLGQQEKESEFTTLSQEQSTLSTPTSQYQNNRFESPNQNLNYQQQTPSQVQSISSQYANHKYSNSNYNYNSQPTSQTSQSTSPENMASPTTSSNSRPISHTSQHSQTEINSATIASNFTSVDNTNSRPSSQSDVFSNDFNLISHSNNIASPQFQPNRYTTEVTQQIATQIHPNINTPTKTNSNQYYSSPFQQNSPVASQIRPSNYDRQPQLTDFSNNIQNYTSNPFATSGIQSNSQPLNYETVNSAPQVTDSANYNQNNQQFNTKPNLNLQTETNQYSSQHNYQTIPTTFNLTNRQPKPSASSNNIQTQLNRFDTSSPLTYPSFNQNLQNTNANRYYSTNPLQTSQATQLTIYSDIRTNAEIQSNRFGTTETQQYSLPNYSSKQNQQINHIALPSFLPKLQTESYQQNRTPPSSSFSYNRLNAQSQANQYDTSQQPSSPSFLSNPNQQNRPITSQSYIPNVQIETNQHYSTNQQQANRSPQTLILPESYQFQTSYPQQKPQTVNSTPHRYPSSLAKPTQNPSNAQTESNQLYSSNIQSNKISQSLSSLNLRPNMGSELNQYYSSYPQEQLQNTYGKPNQNPSTNFASNTQTESNHYYYNNKPQQSIKIPEITTSSNTPQQSNIQTDSNRFLANTPQPSAQNFHIAKPIHSQSNNIPSTHSETSNTPISTINSQPLGNRINFTPHHPSSISSNSNNAFPSLSETPRYTPSKQLFSQNLEKNQQSFLAKVSQTHKAPSRNTVSNFFGQTSVVSALPPLPASSNGNIIPPTSERQPITNSNYLQMQSQSFEIPYYYNKPIQQNNFVTQSEKPLVFTRIPVAASVEPVRLPHLTYGTPIGETSNMYLPPSIIMQPPNFKK